jgi:predicted kinase
VLAALPFFLAVRAAIRAKVTVARLGNVDASQRKAVTAAAQAYFDLAGRSLAPPPPTLVAIGGLSGTGKSTLAGMLAPELAPHFSPEPGAVVVRTDVERKALFSVAETDKLPPDAYAPEVTHNVYALAAQKARCVVEAGHSVIIDAVFAHARERAAVDAIAKTRKVAFRGLFLVADLATRVARVGTRARDASDADAEVARAQQRYHLGALDWECIDASGARDETLSHARATLGLRQSVIAPE